MSVNENTTPVRVRIGEGGDATPLCHWPVDDLKSLLAIFDSWGCADTDGNIYDGSSFGQFVIADGFAYFEIVVAQDGE